MAQGTKGFGLTGMELLYVKVLQADISVTWKQDSMMGYGGNMNETYNQLLYKNKAGVQFPVHVHQAFGKPAKLVIKGNMQYGMSSGNLFLVYHDKTKFKPYQHRFVRTGIQDMIYWANDKLQIKKVKVDASWVWGDYLRDFE